MKKRDKKIFNWIRWGSHGVHHLPRGIWYYGTAGHSTIWNVGDDLDTEPQTWGGYATLDALLKHEGFTRAQCQQIGAHHAK